MQRLRKQGMYLRWHTKGNTDLTLLRVTRLTRETHHDMAEADVCDCNILTVCWVGCWLSVRKSIQPVEIEWWGVGVVICLERAADCLHMVQLMPLHPRTPSFLALFKSRLVLPSWYQLTPVVLKKRPLNIVIVDVSRQFQLLWQQRRSDWCAWRTQLEWWTGWDQRNWTRSQSAVRHWTSSSRIRDVSTTALRSTTTKRYVTVASVKRSHIGPDLQNNLPFIIWLS